MQAAAVDAGIPDPGAAAIRDIIGLGLNEAMQVLFPEQAPARRAELVERYRRHFLELDTTGMPLHKRGISLTPQGLAYLGVEFQRSFSSNTLRGVSR
jgi:phosphoglycolate phosphatase-like HAD superfamily hydrolase